MKKNGIKVEFEAYLYLQELGHKQRTGKELSDTFKARLKQNYDRYWLNGRELCDGDLGGAKNGKSVLWTCKDMKRYLDEAGLKYSECEIEIFGL